MSKNKKGKKQSKSKIKKLRTSLWKENSQCYYCKTLTILPTDFPNLLELQKKGITPDNMATVEHLYSRYEEERFKEGGQDQCVLSCYKCNQEKEREKTSLIPIEELRKRSKKK